MLVIFQQTDNFNVNNKDFNLKFFRHGLLKFIFNSKVTNFICDKSDSTLKATKHNNFKKTLKFCNILNKRIKRYNINKTIFKNIPQTLN